MTPDWFVVKWENGRCTGEVMARCRPGIALILAAELNRRAGPGVRFHEHTSPCTTTTTTKEQPQP